MNNMKSAVILSTRRKTFPLQVAIVCEFLEQKEMSTGAFRRVSSLIFQESPLLAACRDDNLASKI